MLKMNQIEHIIELYSKGITVTEISRLLNIDSKTVRKYCTKDNYSNELHPAGRPKPSKLDKWKSIIDAWHEEDRRVRYKQRHTARRIHNRLSKEYPEYDCSYSVVQRYCQCKNADKKHAKGNQELVWHPGEAQVDFGEADFLENGVKISKKYLACSFPYSNAAFVQIFGGETAECVVQGLADIFEQIQGVPLRLVFDNASGVGRRIKDHIQLSDLFKRFKCHYRFELTFCNPYSGHEKGNVENKVGYTRRNFFVPIPEFDDILQYNQSLFSLCESDFDRDHYKKNQTIRNLFLEEKQSLSPLPVNPFKAVRYERVRTDAYGKICLDGRHWYSSSPDHAQKEIIAEIGAHSIRILSVEGVLIVSHNRMYGSLRTDTTDWSTTVSRLLKNPGSWRNSGLRETIPSVLKEVMDGLEKPQLKGVLKTLKELSAQYSFDTCIRAMEEAAKSGRIDHYSSIALAARLSGSGLNQKELGPDLSQYDGLLNQEASNA
jgi:transposase